MNLHIYWKWLLYLELLCWRRLLRVPWTARRANQSSPKGDQLWMNIHSKDWCWSWSSNTLATWCKEPTHGKRLWWWERLRAGEEGDNRGWDGWRASLTQWTRVHANSRRQWRTGKPGVLQSMGLQRVRHDLETEQQYKKIYILHSSLKNLFYFISSLPCSICHWSYCVSGNLSKD